MVSQALVALVHYMYGGLPAVQAPFIWSSISQTGGPLSSRIVLA